jgi:FkbM family methyltransferase
LTATSSTNQFRQFIALTKDLGVADGVRLFLREIGVRTYQTAKYPGLERTFEVQFDPVWRWIGRGTRERGLIRFAEERIGRDSTVFDVGAHLGESSLLFSELVGPSGRVVAFEPDPVACDILRRNIEMNGMKSVLVEEMSASDKTGKAVLTTQRLGSGAASIVHPPVEGARGRKVEVASTTLDDYCDKRGLIPDLIKIDAEGAEPLVALGMQRLLQEHHPSVILEFHAAGLTNEERGKAWSSIVGRAARVEVLESIPAEHDFLEEIPEGQVPNCEFLIVHLKY